MKEKQRLLLVNGHLNVGGIEKTLIDLLNAIDYSKYEVDLLLLHEMGDYSDQLHPAVRVYCANLRETEGAFFPTMCRLFGKLRIREMVFRVLLYLWTKGWASSLKTMTRMLGLHEQYDVAIAYRTGLSCDVVSYGISAAKKLCWWHNPFFVMSPHEKENQRLAWKRLDKIVAVSQSSKDMLETQYPEFSNKLCVMHNVLDAPRLRELSEGVVPFCNTKEKINIVTVARLEPEKHQDNAVYVADCLKKKRVLFHWYILGDGSTRKMLEKEIEKHDLIDCVTLCGNVVNPYPYIKNATIMVHTSYEEAHCTSMLEGMALGTPCVVTRTTLPQDFTIDGYNCLIAEQNADSLLDSVLRLMNDEALLKMFVKNGRESVVQYSPQTIYRDFIRIIDGTNS